MCKELKSVADFHKKHSRHDGLQDICKSCKKIQNNKYWKSENGKMAARRRKEKSPDKIISRYITRQAVHHGIISKENCVVCGDDKVEAHHKHYFRPLDIVWLCPKHHREIHTSINAQ